MRIALASNIALLSILLVAPFAAGAANPLVRTKSGVLYEIPAGWDWGGFSGSGLTIQHQGTAVDGRSPNRFEVVTTDDYGKYYGRIYFIAVNATKADGCSRPASKSDVLEIARSLKSWDGK